jgi:DNA polymerase-1
MVYLIDASVYVFRAYFSIPDHITDPVGNPVNAVYGFARFLAEFLKDCQPEYVAVAFDQSLTTSFRNDIYPDYKANREKPPQELKAQFAHCRALCDALGLHQLASPAFEADDLIGTLVSLAHGAGLPVTIVSRDKDLAQLIRRGDIYYEFASRQRMDYDGVAAKFGVPPERIADWLALTGDSVDNIPGVPGIGPKTATALLAGYADIDALYQALDEVAELPIRGASKLPARLKLHADAVELARQLTHIKCDIPLNVEVNDLRRQPASPGLDSLFDQLGFGQQLRQELRRLGV